MTHRGHPYSVSGAWMLDNPIRRLIQPPSELVEKLDITQGQTVVDFGCGPGYFTVELAKKAAKVIAVDLSMEMLEKAKRKTSKAHAENVDFLQSNGTKIKLDDTSVDLILLVTVFHEIGEEATVLGEFSRILKPSGKLVIVEVIKKGTVPGAPMQNPQAIKSDLEAANFKLQQMQPYKNYGVFFFTKNA
jgi:ubiquinone/menaquinone biosynthesis C-methylase UbiE